jgi:hypothetical protein
MKKRKEANPRVGPRRYEVYFKVVWVNHQNVSKHLRVYYEDKRSREYYPNRYKGTPAEREIKAKKAALQFVTRLRSKRGVKNHEYVWSNETLKASDATTVDVIEVRSTLVRRD